MVDISHNFNVVVRVLAGFKIPEKYRNIYDIGALFEHECIIVLGIKAHFPVNR